MASNQDQLTAEVQKKVLDAFGVFDHEQNKTVDVREIGTIMRSLGHCPSQAEIQEVLRDMEDPQEMGYINLDRFFSAMTKIILQQRYTVSPAEQLFKAFLALDKENKGYLTPEELRHYFTQYGEPFSAEEMDEMLEAAVDPATRTVQYRTFVHYLTLEDL